MKFLVVVFFIFSSQQSLAQVGLARGSNFNAVTIDGNISVTCFDARGNSQQANYWCHDNILEPSPYDYFIGPDGVIADTVRLIARSNDGSSRDKSEDYNADQHRSEDPINLWFNTPFQDPLLKEGKNKISFSLLRDNIQVANGAFEVNVIRLSPRLCERENYQSNNPSDCQSQYSVCQSYFQRHDFCR